MSDLPPSKRRRLATNSDSPDPLGSSSQSSPSSFSIDTFRLQLSAYMYLFLYERGNLTRFENRPELPFFLGIANSINSRRKGRLLYYSPPFHWSVPPLFSTLLASVLSDARQSRDDLLSRHAQCVVTIRDFLLNGFHGIPPSSLVRFISPSRGYPSLHAAISPEKVLHRLLKGMRLSRLRAFYGLSCAATPETIQLVGGYGKESLILALAALFLRGEIPGSRAQEERQVLFELDLNSCYFTLCDRVVPRDLVVEILSFCHYDRTLLTSVGLICWDFFALVLSSWREVTLHNGNCSGPKAIPQTVFRFTRRWKINPVQLRLPEMKRIVSEDLPLDRIVRLEMISPPSGYRNSTHLTRFLQTMDSRCSTLGDLYSNLRKLVLSRMASQNLTRNFQSWSSFGSTVNKPMMRASQSCRLLRLNRYLRTVKWPLHIEWCEGLRLDCLYFDNACLGHLENTRPLEDLFMNLTSLGYSARRGYRRNDAIEIPLSESLMERLEKVKLFAHVEWISRFLDAFPNLEESTRGLRAVDITERSATYSRGSQAIKLNPNLTYSIPSLRRLVYEKPSHRSWSMIVQPNLGFLTELRICFPTTNSECIEPISQNTQSTLDRLCEVFRYRAADGALLRKLAVKIVRENDNGIRVSTSGRYLLRIERTGEATPSEECYPRDFFLVLAVLKVLGQDNLFRPFRVLNLRMRYGQSLLEYDSVSELLRKVSNEVGRPPYYKKTRVLGNLGSFVSGTLVGKWNF